MNLQRYMELAFGTAFPRARVRAAYHGFSETWIVVVDDRGLHLYAMSVGSDDDSCYFTCISDANRAPVNFPLPEEF